MATGHFRQDLFYRLNVFPITVTALRKRKEDIPELTEHFLKQAARKFHRPELRLTRANILSLQAYDWPGNVRELQNVIERAVITAQANILHFDLPSSRLVNAGTTKTETGPARVMTEEEIRLLERENMEAALKFSNGKIYGTDGAAELIGLKPTTFISRMKKMKIRPHRDSQNQ